MLPILPGAAPEERLFSLVEGSGSSVSSRRALLPRCLFRSSMSALVFRGRSTLLNPSWGLVLAGRLMGAGRAIGCVVVVVLGRF